MVNVTFVHRGGERMASYRYRCAIPAQELAKHGHNVFINGGDAHICIFSKPTQSDLRVATEAKANGCVIIADIGDDHFDHEELGDLYREMLLIADHTVAPTQVMAEKHAEQGAKGSTVIPDPYEVPRETPHANGDKLLWFGGSWNWKDIELYQNLPNLKIVVGPNTPDGAVHWSPENQSRALSEANVVLLPHRPGVEYKTANRLINAVQAGCFVIADPHPSYTEFRDFLWLGGIPTGLRWAKENQIWLNSGVREAQKYIEKHYSPTAIGEKWNDLINSFASTSEQDTTIGPVAGQTMTARQT